MCDPCHSHSLRFSNLDSSLTTLEPLLQPLVPETDSALALLISVFIPPQVPLQDVRCVISSTLLLALSMPPPLVGSGIIPRPVTTKVEACPFLCINCRSDSPCSFIEQRAPDMGLYPSRLRGSIYSSPSTLQVLLISSPLCWDWPRLITLLFHSAPTHQPLSAGTLIPALASSYRTCSSMRLGHWLPNGLSIRTSRFVNLKCEIMHVVAFPTTMSSMICGPSYTQI